MVEEIVGRYLAARPVSAEAEDEPSEEEEEPEPPKKRKRWPYVLGGLAVIVLVGVFSTLFSQLDRLYSDTQNLQMNVGEIRYDVNNQIYSITRRVEEVLQSQNTLTAEQSAEVTDTDYRANTVTVTAQALPRTYVEGMTAEFILTSGGETVTVPGEQADNHAFTARLTGPLADDITVSVAFLTGDQRQTQLLNQFDSLYANSFPKVDMDFGLWGWGGKADEYAFVRVGEENAAKIASLRVGLFRDQTLLTWYEHLEERPSNYQGAWPEGAEFFHLDGTWTMEEGHIYCIAAVIVDEYGRERVCSGFPVTYDSTLDKADYYAPDGILRTDPDPANWDY